MSGFKVNVNFGSDTFVAKPNFDIRGKANLKNIEFFENGIYKPEDYGADGFGEVNVDVQPTLEELTITDNGTYTPQEGVDGFSKVTANFDTSSLPKVKVTSISVNESCFNNGVWEGGASLDTSEVTGINSLFKNMTSLTNVDVSGWNTKNIVSADQAFMGTTNLQFLNVSNWNVTNLQSCSYMFAGSAVSTLNFINWDVSNVTNVNYMFYLCGNLSSIVGDIEDVSEDISCLKNLRVSIGFNSSPNLNLASILALVNGLAGLTEETRQTLTLGSTIGARLDKEQIAGMPAKDYLAIKAGEKYWTIAY